MATLEQILQGPGLQPPPGVVPNFVNPHSQSAANLACNIICLTVATICIAIRMYTRFVITRAHGWEDYTCIVAWLGLIAYATLMLIPIFNHNAGIHQWDIRVIDLIKWTKIANGIEIAYIPIIFITKLSILLLFLRVFVPGGRTRTYWIIQGVILFNFLFYLANLPVEIWPCVPRSKLWTPTEPGHCINNEEVFVAGGTINMVSDFTILLLPIVEVWRLQMSTQRKIGVSAVFATGLFGCISSIMHLVTSVASAKSPDKTYYLFPVAMWTIAEIASGIVCNCLITMPHFFRHFAPILASKLASFPLLTRTRSRSTGPGSKFVLRAAAAAAKASNNSSSNYESASSRAGGGGGGGKEDYMELGDSNTWRGPAKAKGEPARGGGRGEGGRWRTDDEWSGGGGAVGGRDWGMGMGRGPVAHLPSNVTSIYSDV